MHNLTEIITNQLIAQQFSVDESEDGQGNVASVKLFIEEDCANVDMTKMSYEELSELVKQVIYDNISGLSWD